MNLTPEQFDIPRDITDAALLVQRWMDSNGHKDWRLLGIADRRLVPTVQAANAHLTPEQAAKDIIQRLYGSPASENTTNEIAEMIRRCLPTSTPNQPLDHRISEIERLKSVISCDAKKEINRLNQVLDSNEIRLEFLNEQNDEFRKQLDEIRDYLQHDPAIATIDYLREVRANLIRRDHPAIVGAIEQIEWVFSEGQGDNQSWFYYCPFCKSKTSDYTLMRHADDCKGLTALTALQALKEGK